MKIEVIIYRSPARECPQGFNVIFDIEPPLHIDKTSRGYQGVILFSSQSRDLTFEYITDLLNYFGITQFQIKEEFVGGLFLERRYNVINCH